MERRKTRVDRFVGLVVVMRGFDRWLGPRDQRQRVDAPFGGNFFVVGSLDGGIPHWVSGDTHSADAFSIVWQCLDLDDCRMPTGRLLLVIRSFRMCRGSRSFWDTPVGPLQNSHLSVEKGRLREHRRSK